MERCLVLWCPDWPVAAYLRGRGEPERAAPIAVFAQNLVVACNAAARQEGIRRGMRRRDAQSRCPALRIAAEDPARDAREFLPIADRIERLAPGLQIMRPGLCALRIRGAARYYGGELPAALALVQLLREEGIDVRAGVADGRFAAEQAARAAADAIVIEEGGSSAFLAPLPVETLDEEPLTKLLGQLGIRTLGDFARLGAREVLDRFGPSGALRHALAAGDDSRRFEPRAAPPDHTREIAFEPPVAIADQVAFGVRVAAEQFIAGLAQAGLACTEVRVELVGPDGDAVERVWAHPAAFGATSVVERVRWQLEAAATGTSLRGGVSTVRIAPEVTGSISAHEPGLYGRPDERVVHALSRVQAMLGHRGVATASVGGGRRLADRQVLTPWGERAPRSLADRPWPGALPAPHPASVYPRPIPVQVEHAGGAPEWITADGARSRVTAWAGPWPLVERGWSPAERRRADRYQVVDEAGRAWALLLEQGGEWSAEGRYD